MTAARSIACALLGLAFLSTTSAGSVEAKFDEKVDFSTLHTVAWAKGMPAQDKQIQDHIVAAVQDELTARGLTFVEGDADLHVSTHAFAVDEGAAMINRYSAQWLEIEAVKVGTLIVDIARPETEELVWRGTAKKTFKLKAKPSEKKIRGVVKKLFSDFPR